MYTYRNAIRAVIASLTLSLALVAVVISGTASAYAAPRTQSKLYTSCTAERGVTATPTGGAPVAATAAATEVAATQDAAATPSDQLAFYRIAGAESEACYQVGEVFFQENNRFNLAVGVTKSIDGQVAVDTTNIANSIIGDIVINISEFQSDSGRRDGIIRQRWLESNKYPLAKLTDSRTEGLPARPYKDGEVLDFKVIGTLEIHATKKETTFTMQASMKDGALVITGYTDIKMSDFGFEAPSIGGMLKANEDVHFVLNLVARPDAGK